MRSAAVSDLQHVGAQVDATCEQLRLARFAGIAGEQLAELPSVRPAVVQHRNEAVLVHVIARVGEERRRRRQEVERHTFAGGPAHAAPGEHDGPAAQVRPGDAVPVPAPAIRLARVEQQVDGHGLDDRGATAGVVALGNRLT